MNLNHFLDRYENESITNQNRLVGMESNMTLLKSRNLIIKFQQLPSIWITEGEYNNIKNESMNIGNNYDPLSAGLDRLVQMAIALVAIALVAKAIRINTFATIFSHGVEMPWTSMFIQIHKVWWKFGVIVFINHSHLYNNNINSQCRFGEI